MNDFIVVSHFRIIIISFVVKELLFQLTVVNYCWLSVIFWILSYFVVTNKVHYGVQNGENFGLGVDISVQIIFIFRETLSRHYDQNGVFIGQILIKIFSAFSS